MTVDISCQKGMSPSYYMCHFLLLLCWWQTNLGFFINKSYFAKTLYLLGLLWGILSSVNFLIAIILFTISKLLSFGLFLGQDL